MGNPLITKPCSCALSSKVAALCNRSVWLTLPHNAVTSNMANFLCIFVWHQYINYMASKSIILMWWAFILGIIHHPNSYLRWWFGHWTLFHKVKDLLCWAQSKQLFPVSLCSDIGTNSINLAKQSRFFTWRWKESSPWNAVSNTN